jgi:hypothetical protein
MSDFITDHWTGTILFLQVTYQHALLYLNNDGPDGATNHNTSSENNEDESVSLTAL